MKRTVGFENFISDIGNKVRREGTYHVRWNRPTSYGDDPYYRNEANAYEKANTPKKLTRPSNGSGIFNTENYIKDLESLIIE